MVLVANTANTPMSIRLSLVDVQVPDGPAAVLFANRNASVQDHVIVDWIDALGTRAYRVGLSRPVPTEARVSPHNVLSNPSFELSGSSAVGAGGSMFPDGYWTVVGNDTSAAAFAETRDSVHGMRSLRIVTPADHHGIMVIAYPVEAATQHPGKKFTLSLWSRGVGVNDGPQPVLRFGCPYYLTSSWESVARQRQHPRRGGRGPDSGVGRKSRRSA